MAHLETLAQPYVRDDSTWKKGNGANKGFWVYDGSWQQVLELYVYNGSEWKYVYPIHGVDCQLIQTSDGTCGGADATYSIQSRWFGPMPQSTSGTGPRYFIASYSRISSVSEADLLNTAWSQQQTQDLITSLMSPNPISYSFVITTGTTDRWHQVQARLVHSVDGEVPLASGGIITSAIRTFTVDTCIP